MKSFRPFDQWKANKPETPPDLPDIGTSQLLFCG